MWSGVRGIAVSKTWLAIVALVVGLWVAQAAPVRAEQPRILVSIPPLALIAQAVFEEKATVSVLLNGINPHDYVMKPSDIYGLRRADAIFWVGPGVDGFLQKPLAAPELAGRHLSLLKQEALEWPPVVTLDHAQEHEADSDNDHDHSGLDPHIWVSPHNAVVIAHAMVQFARDNALFGPSEIDQLEARVTLLASEWGRLQAQWQQRLQGLPAFYSYHQAYGHLAFGFGLRQADAVTRNPEQQPGVKHLLKVAASLTQSACLLVEPYYEQRLAEQLQHRTGVKLVSIDLLASAAMYESYGQWLETAMLEPLQRCLEKSR